VVNLVNFAFQFKSMPKINFFNEDSNYALKGKTSIKKWISETISAEGFKLSELNFIFCSDEYLLRINQDFLQHDYYTDVITFDNSEELKTILGDIFISIDRVKDNAKQNDANTADELCRIMIHGTLHLLGYKDKSKKDKITMTAKEDYYLKKRS
jgi:rRNA maturation RNase YbeY